METGGFSNMNMVSRFRASALGALAFTAATLSPAAAQTPSGSACPYIAYGAVLTAALTTDQRKKIPMGEFALPGRRYPIDTRARAVNALARVEQNGTQAEKAAVRKAVCGKYGDLPSCK